MGLRSEVHNKLCSHWNLSVNRIKVIKLFLYYSIGHGKFQFKVVVPEKYTMYITIEQLTFDISSSSNS